MQEFARYLDFYSLLSLGSLGINGARPWWRLTPVACRIAEELESRRGAKPKLIRQRCGERAREAKLDSILARS